MDVYIRTQDPDEIDAERIAVALMDLNYYVAAVFINDDVCWTEDELADSDDSI